MPRWRPARATNAIRMDQRTRLATGAAAATRAWASIRHGAAGPSHDKTLSTHVADALWPQRSRRFRERYSLGLLAGMLEQNYPCWQSDMARHTYRVTDRLVWIDDGRPGTNLGRLGGDPVVYHPGSTVTVDDREVPAIYHCLKATDAAARAILDRARAAMDAPAAVTPCLMRQANGSVSSDESPGSLHPNAYAWLIRDGDDTLRQQERIRELVDRMLARGERPTHQDLTTAVHQARNAPSPALKDHVYEIFLQPQRPGPKYPPRTTSEDLAIKACYELALETARVAYEEDSRQPRAVTAVAAAATATAFSHAVRPMSARTVQRVIAAFAERPWLRDDASV